MNNSKTNFGSKIGAILAVAGSAVGLGNVWRFPTEAGENGGAAFIFIYVLIMIFFGVPVMISELAIGRHGQKNVSHSFLKMSNGKKAWGWMGFLPVIAGFLVLGYYSVIAGWVVAYLFEALGNGFAGKTSAEYATDFSTFSSGIFGPIACIFVIMLLTCGIVLGGVQKGIERAAKTMMPILFVCLVVLAGCALTLPGAEKGLMFLFSPDFSKVTSETVLSAMGQAFFSLSVGICCMCTYGCYFRKDVDMMKSSLSVAGIDTFVALMSGLIVFPVVYSIAGLQPDEGPALVFITLPNVFQQVFSGIPALAYGFSVMFYLLLAMAALTSTISMLEMVASIFIRKYKFSRPAACIMVTAVCFLVSIASSLSFGVWSDVTIFGMTLFDFFDFIVAKFLMPIGALLICLFVGWVVDEKVLRSELTNEGTLRQPLYPLYRFIVRFVTPVCIVLIFLNELELF